MRFYIPALILSIFLILTTTNISNAQSALGLPTTDGETPSSITLPDPLTREALRDVLSGLDDKQARELLLNELDSKIAEQEALNAAKDQRSVLQLFGYWGQSLVKSVKQAVVKIPDTPVAFQKAFENFKSRRGDASLWRVPAFLALIIAISFFAVIVVSLIVRKHEQKLNDYKPENLSERIKAVCLRFALQALRVIAFLGTAALTNDLLNSSIAVDNLVVSDIMKATGWTLFAIMLARFVFSPFRSDLRLCHADDQTAKFLTFRIGLIFGWSAFSLGLLFRLSEFGWVLGDFKIGFWFNLIFHGLIVLTIWQARTDITKMIAVDAEETSGWMRFAKLWPMIAIGLVTLEWLIVEVVVATGNVASLSLSAINFTLGLILILPLLEHAIPAVVKELVPVDEEHSESHQKADLVTQNSAIRFARMIVLFLVTLLLAKLWGLSLSSFSQNDAQSELVGAIAGAFMVIIFALVAREILNVLTKRYALLERAAIEVENPDAAAYGLTRLETVLPLIRAVGGVIILILTALAILADIGVNIVPLIAGAGVIGIAIGFGAQTLVKDIISGIFFLIDDAFRKDEYIDIGQCMGTVEKLSIRSMQLRHHDGALNTIPFGEITQVANYSRDWGIMRLLLRVTYDTDVDRMSDLLATLGEEMLEDPAIGKKFAVKLTPEGVINTDDSALIFRAAYKTKALDQWAMRGRIYARIRDMFDREGIKFASHDVTVRITDEVGKSLDEDQKSKVVAAAAQTAVKQKHKK